MKGLPAVKALSNHGRKRKPVTAVTCATLILRLTDGFLGLHNSLLEVFLSFALYRKIFIGPYHLLCSSSRRFLSELAIGRSGDDTSLGSGRKGPLPRFGVLLFFYATFLRTLIIVL